MLRDQNTKGLIASLYSETIPFNSTNFSVALSSNASHVFVPFFSSGLAFIRILLRPLHPLQSIMSQIHFRFKRHRVGSPRRVSTISVDSDSLIEISWELLLSI